MFSLFKKIWEWLKVRFKKPDSYVERIDRKASDFSRQTVKVCFLKEVPAKAKKNTIYFIGENNFYWMAGLLCPCGCGDFIHLNLLKGVSPQWKYKISRGLISISPSIWRTLGCKSHFSIRRGEIIWVRNLV